LYYFNKTMIAAIQTNAKKDASSLSDHVSFAKPFDLSTGHGSLHNRTRCERFPAIHRIPSILLQLTYYNGRPRFPHFGMLRRKPA
jgi:hypothetical protein